MAEGGQGGEFDSPLDDAIERTADFGMNTGDHGVASGMDYKLFAARKSLWPDCPRYSQPTDELQQLRESVNELTRSRREGEARELAQLEHQLHLLKMNELRSHVADRQADLSVKRDRVNGKSTVNRRPGKVAEQLGVSKPSCSPAVTASEYDNSDSDDRPASGMHTSRVRSRVSFATQHNKGRHGQPSSSDSSTTESESRSPSSADERRRPKRRDKGHGNRKHASKSKAHHSSRHRKRLVPIN